MKIKIGDETVGHVSIEISNFICYFVKKAGTIEGEVTGKRQRLLIVGKGQAHCDLPNNLHHF